MVVVDLFTKYSLYIPCTKDIDAPGLATLFYEKVMPLWGMPENLVSDRGTIFIAKFWSHFCFLLATRRRLSTAFHPQTDGQTERQNQNIEYYLRNTVSWCQDDWMRWIPLAQMVYNNATHSALKMSPAEALLGIRPELRTSVPDEKVETHEDASARVEEMLKMREELRRRLEESKAIIKRAYDKKHIDKSFSVGQ